MLYFKKQNNVIKAYTNKMLQYLSMLTILAICDIRLWYTKSTEKLRSVNHCGRRPFAPPCWLIIL